MNRKSRTYEPFANTFDASGDRDSRWPLLLKLDHDSFSRQSIRFSSVVLSLALVRLASAVFNNIHDCDETYNYLEPLHFILRGTGLQTWEYSPQYAIRSYAYLWMYAAPLWMLDRLVTLAPPLIFYLLRIGCALASTGAEAYMYSGLTKQFGSEVGRVSLAILLFSAGMFVSSTGVLPSTFSMYTTCVAYAAYWHRHYRISIIACGVSVLVGWPFAAILK
jgi:alpha-1,2-mannosyltransferase